VNELLANLLEESTGSWLGMVWQAGADAAPAAADAAAAVSGDVATTAAEPSAVEPSAPGSAPKNQPNFFVSLLQNPLFLPAGLVLMFYLLVLGPERRRQAEVAKKRAGLKKNDRVLTSGGIYGTVVSVAPDSDEIQLRVDETNNTKIRVTRSSIATVLTSGKEDSAT
jgi:preprotein translocase subunit YajC